MNCIKRLIFVNMFIMLMTTCVIAKEIQIFNHDELLSEYERSDETYQKYVNEGLPYRIRYQDYNTGKITYEYFNCEASEYENETVAKMKSTKKKSKKKKNNKSSNVNETYELNINEIINNYTESINNQNDEEKNVGWVEFNGAWYYQDEKGNNKSGWQYIGDKWYYLDKETYIMATGLKELNGKKYFFKDDGSMATNYWKNLDGNNYYFGADGTMIVNETRKGTDGKKYYFDGNGVAVDLGTSSEFFNYAYNASALNDLRGNCKYWVSYGQAGIYSLRASLETYQSYLNQCYRIDSAKGNQKGIEEEKKAFAEIQEWLR